MFDLDLEVRNFIIHITWPWTRHNIQVYDITIAIKIYIYTYTGSPALRGFNDVHPVPGGALLPASHGPLSWRGPGHMFIVIYGLHGDQVLTGFTNWQGHRTSHWEILNCTCFDLLYLLHISRRINLQYVNNIFFLFKSCLHPAQYEYS